MDIEPYDLITTAAGLRRALKGCHGPTALDFETTSLSPKDGRVRLVQLRNDNGVRCVVDFDRIKGGFAACAHMFVGDLGPFVAFYTGFEMRWFLAAGAVPHLVDVGHLRRAVMGGGRFSLAQMVEWDLERKLDKNEQASNWGDYVLTKSQLDYAMLDADVTWELWVLWSSRSTARHDQAAQMLDDMLLGVIEMEESGLLLDRRAHKELVQHWERKRDEFAATVRANLPEDVLPNLQSNHQLSDLFSSMFPPSVLALWPRTDKTGKLKITGTALRTVAGMYRQTPVEATLDALANYRKAQKYLSSFGDTVIAAAARSPDGRVRARFNVGAAVTLRFSSSGPNLQQVPRDKVLFPGDTAVTSMRRSFVAPAGRLLVSYDYSAIELRVLALLSKDDQLLHDVVCGDVHSEVAAVIAGGPIDKTTREGKEARSAAKGVSFGIIYGSAASGLSLTMRTSVESAQSYIDFWANRYPRAYDYRNVMQAQARTTGYIEMVDGGTIYMGRRSDLPKCANYPVQRAALSIMARAITRHKNTLDELRSTGEVSPDSTRMLATIHDALIDEAAVQDAPRVQEAMEADMVAAYLDWFPGASTDRLIEGGRGQNWASLE